MPVIAHRATIRRGFSAFAEAARDLGSLAFTGPGWHALDRRAMLPATATDGFVWCCTRGRSHSNGMATASAPSDPHIIFSVSKSITGILAGILVGARAARPRRAGHALRPGSGRLGLWRLHGAARARHDRRHRVRGKLSRHHRRLRALSRRDRLESGRRPGARDRPAQLPGHAAARREPARRQVPLRLAQLRHAGLDPGARRRPAVRAAGDRADLAEAGRRGRRPCDRSTASARRAPPAASA